MTIKILKLLIGVFTLFLFSCQNSEIVEKYPNGSKKMEYIYTDNDRRNWRQRNYYETGQLAFEIEHKDGQKHGREVVYYESGKIKSRGSFIQGSRDGKFEYFYPNGLLKEVEWYYNDKLHGITKVYYEDGTLKGEYSYKEGKKDGEIKSYYKNGKIKTLWVYQNGKSVSDKRYSKTGELIYYATADSFYFQKGPIPSIDDSYQKD